MLNFSQSALSDADVLIYVTDVVETLDKNEDFLALVKAQTIPLLLLINKIDLSNQEELDTLVSKWKEELPHAEIIPVSAKSGFNLDYVLRRIQEQIPESEPYFDKDALTDKPTRFFVNEIIREKIFLFYQKEIPYSTEVVVEEYKDTVKLVSIRAVIYVERESQKGIVIGHGGKALKKIGTESRRDIEAFLGKKVFLELYVKVETDWRSKENVLKNFGYRLD